MCGPDQSKKYWERDSVKNFEYQFFFNLPHDKFKLDNIHINVKQRNHKIAFYKILYTGSEDEYEARTEISALWGIRAMAIMSVESRKRSWHALDTSCKFLHTLPSAIRYNS